MTRKVIMDAVRWRRLCALFALAGLGAFSADVLLAQATGEDDGEPAAAQEEDFGAGDFASPAPAQEEAPQRIDLGNSGGGTVITPGQAAAAASPRTVTDGDESADGESEAGVDDSVFVPTEEIRVDSAIAFPVDI